MNITLPFASSLVEMRHRHDLPAGVSTSLDTNGGI